MIAVIQTATAGKTEPLPNPLEVYSLTEINQALDDGYEIERFRQIAAEDCVVLTFFLDK